MGAEDYILKFILNHPRYLCTQSDTQEVRKDKNQDPGDRSSNKYLFPLFHFVYSQPISR